MAKRKKAGHRTWGAQGKKVPGKHEGDIMPTETRSRVMSRIRHKDTSPELAMDRELSTFGIPYERHCKDLPGKPDFVFRAQHVVVFVDGDFWHGFRFPLWKHKLSEKWQQKIETTRTRDNRNFAKLRRLGWKVVRIWEHQIEQSLERCTKRIREAMSP